MRASRSALVLVSLLTLVAALAATLAQPTSAAPGSRLAPLAESAPAVTVGLIQTGQYDSPLNRLTDLGISVTLLPTTSGLTEFQAYDVIYLPVNWAQATNGALATLEEHAQAYRDYVAAGGGLLIDQPNPYGQPDNSAVPTLLPYAITFDSGYTNNDHPPIIADPLHYLTEGLLPEDLPFPCDTLTNVAAQYDILVVGRQTGRPSLLVAEYGAGRVLIQAASPLRDFSRPFSDEAYLRMVRWVSQRETDPTPTPEPTATATSTPSPTLEPSATPSPTATTTVMPSDTQGPTNTPLPSNTPAASTTPAVTTTPATVILNPANTNIRDTDIYAWNADAVQPGARRNRLYVRKDVYNALSWFDIAAYVPSNATVQRATLYLYLSFYEHMMAQSPVVSVFAVNKLWDPLQATWNDRLTAAAWAGAGCSGADDRVLVAAASATITSVSRWYEWDITALVQGWAGTPSTNEGMLLTSNSGRELRFYSADDADQRFVPFIQVTYTTPGTAVHEPTATPSTTPTSTPTPGLRLTLSSVPPTDVGLCLGELITYTIAYANDAPGVAKQCQITCPLPDDTLYAPGSASASGAYNLVSGEVRWFLGDVAGGAAGEVSFAVRVDVIPRPLGSDNEPGAPWPQQIVNDGASALWGLPPDLHDSRSNAVTNRLSPVHTLLLLPLMHG